MSIFDSEGDLLPGLLPAAFRGVTFQVVDAGHDVGRRIISNYFPGLDARTQEDLGIFDGPIDVAGFVIGDDYVAQAKALQRAFQTAGPGTFLHPWLGEMTVVLPEPARIDFNVKELRVARIQVTFERATIGGMQILSTLTGLLSSLGSFVGAAQGLVTGLLSARALPVMFWSAARSMADTVSSTLLSQVSASAGSGTLLPAIETLAESLAEVDAMAFGTPAASRLAEIVASLPDPVVALASPARARAIGLGGKPLPAPSVTMDPRAGARLLLATSRKIRSLEVFSASDRAVVILAEAAHVAAAARLVSDMAFESRQEAVAWRNDLDRSVQQVGQSASELATENVALASRIWQSAEATRAAIALDINEVLGRLPSVRTITSPRTVSAFLLAQYLVGDDPRQVVPMVNDIRSRNRLRHPGSIPPDPIEVLA